MFNLKTILLSAVVCFVTVAQVSANPSYCINCPSRRALPAEVLEGRQYCCTPDKK
ncbi:hypothetical protein B0H10DRAFT_2219127 [Mycena sp. CBHHK59/15]|nr:hypothetical protein B0H10DRAFT_2219127 [Mycena sp. CBHHK59/15]